MAGALRPRAKTVERIDKGARARPLKAEDRLLGVADDEQRPARAMRLFRLDLEIVLDDGLDQIPLRAIGVLRFVDEDMVDTLVELVADPLGDARRIEQCAGPADQIVEIGDAGEALGSGIGLRIGTASRQPLRRFASISHLSGQVGERLELRADLLGQRDIIGLGGKQLLVVPVLDLAFLGHQRAQQRPDQRNPLRLARRAPLRNGVGSGKTGLGAPLHIGIGEAVQRRSIDLPVIAALGDGLFQVAGRQGRENRGNVPAMSCRRASSVRVAGTHFAR